jgi:quinoprotein glucose dehydrogenase
LQGVPFFPALTGIGTRQSAQEIASITRTWKGRMPGFSKDKISDSEISALMHFFGASELKQEDSSSADIAEMNRYRFTGYHKFRDPDGYPAVTPPWGKLNAIDLNTGKYLWTVPLGDYPELAAKGMGNTGTENYGGPIVTAGGIVVIGATVFDKKIRAFDSRTGVELWEYELPFAGAATPTTYMIDGKQYIVIAAGGQRQSKGAANGSYVAFALP